MKTALLKIRNFVINFIIVVLSVPTAAVALFAWFEIPVLLLMTGEEDGSVTVGTIIGLGYLFDVYLVAIIILWFVPLTRKFFIRGLRFYFLVVAMIFRVISRTSQWISIASNWIATFTSGHFDQLGKAEKNKTNYFHEFVMDLKNL